MDSEILERKLVQTFPEQDQCEMARAELARYGTEGYEREPVRVRLAILKLSGSSLERLTWHVDQAKSDYRDVLAWAESPSELKLGPSVVGPRRRAAQDRDHQQYQQWLLAE